MKIHDNRLRKKKVADVAGFQRSFSFDTPLISQRRSLMRIPKPKLGLALMETI